MKPSVFEVVFKISDVVEGRVDVSRKDVSCGELFEVISVAGVVSWQLWGSELVDPIIFSVLSAVSVE